MSSFAASASVVRVRGLIRVSDAESPDPSDGPYYVQESKHAPGRPSKRAEAYHTNADCQMLDRAMEMGAGKIQRLARFSLCGRCAADDKGEVLGVADGSKLAWRLSQRGVTDFDDIPGALEPDDADADVKLQ